MIRKIAPTRGLMILILLALALALVACERPLQPDAAATAEAQPTVDPVQPTIPPPATVEVPPVDLPPDAEDGTGTEGEPVDEGTTTEGETPAAEEGAGEETGAEPAGDGTYTVQAGDTLYSIATSYGLTVDEMATANNLANPDVLEVGQVLVIPGAGSGDETAGDTGDTGDTGDEGEAGVTPEQEYTIQPGDTLGRIGQRFGFTPEELAAYNNMAVTDTIYVGDTILIPPSDFSLPDEGDTGDEGDSSG